MTAFAHLLHSDHAAKAVIIVKWSSVFFGGQVWILVLKETIGNLKANLP